MLNSGPSEAPVGQMQENLRAEEVVAQPEAALIQPVEQQVPQAAAEVAPP